MPEGTLRFPVFNIEKVPSNFGNWSGPGYAGGIYLSTSTDKDGKIFQDTKGRSRIP